MPLPSYPPAIIAIGKNYADHAIEMGGKAPDNLVVFLKNPACIVGPACDIVVPPICRVNGPQVDFEGELAVVIGRTCRDVAEADALACVSAYAAANDVTARWWQREGSGGQFSRGKSFDTFCPMSVPLSALHVPDPQALRIVTTLNGQIMQDASTGLMIHPVARIISDLSRGMTLLAGTVILTGSPAGVGFGRKPQVFLRDGDVVEVAIEGVGMVRNQVRDGV